MITYSLLWKDTKSGSSESSTCVPLKHKGKTGIQLFTQMKPIYTLHIQHPVREVMGGEQD